MTISTLELSCHVKPTTPALLTITVNGTETQFELSPTINWVPSSTNENSYKIRVPLDISNGNTFDFKINAERSDVLVCNYQLSKGHFQISTQPVWNVPGWQPYDIAGHQGDNAQFQGNGSLQILDGQTVEFTGLVVIQTP